MWAQGELLEDALAQPAGSRWFRILGLKPARILQKRRSHKHGGSTGMRGPSWFLCRDTN